MSERARSTPAWGSVLSIPAGRITALQGLRGAAVILVVISHSVPETESSIAAGVMGVTVFFTLSGFLITGVLIGPRTENIWRLGGFYAARAARLLPALLVLVVATGTVWCLSGRSLATFIGYAASSLLYVENFFAAQHDQQILAHTWSLAVEEQFYLIWPLALAPVLAMRPRRRLILLCVLTLASVSLRFLLFRVGFGHEAYASLPSNAFALLLGCALRLAPLDRTMPRWVARVGLIGVAILAMVGGSIPAPTVATPAFTAALTVLVIAGALHGNGLLDSPPLVFLGSVSYAWYLWHWPILWLTGSLHRLPDALLPDMISLAIAVASTYVLENPLRRLVRARHCGKERRDGTTFAG